MHLTVEVQLVESYDDLNEACVEWRFSPCNTSLVSFLVENGHDKHRIESWWNTDEYREAVLNAERQYYEHGAYPK